MNAVRLRRPALALASACAAALLVLGFGPQRPTAEARRHADPSPAATLSAAPSPEASAQASPQAAASPSSGSTTTPSPADSASPVPSPSGSPDGRKRPARPTPPPTPAPTPTSPAFSSLDGYWEVVVQTTSDNFYSRFDLRQSADAVTGVWTRDGKKLPIEGTYGGRQFKFVAKDDAQTLTLTGYIENASDMVGIVDDGSGKTPTAFTASHRGAYRTNILPKRGEKRSSS